MTEYMLATTDDYRAYADHVQELGEDAELVTVRNAAACIRDLADRADYLENMLERLDEWICDFAYYEDGSKV